MRFLTSNRDRANPERNGAINERGGRTMAKKMLVIDDEQIVLESCRKIFEAEGFEVVTTLKPDEGLRLAL
jgi:PleD family two-component response regulator